VELVELQGFFQAQDVERLRLAGWLSGFGQLGGRNIPRRVSFGLFRAGAGP